MVAYGMCGTVTELEPGKCPLKPRGKKPNTENEEM